MVLTIPEHNEHNSGAFFRRHFPGFRSSYCSMNSSITPFSMMLQYSAWKRGEQYMRGQSLHGQLVSHSSTLHPHIYSTVDNGLMPREIDSFAVSPVGNLDRMVRAEPHDVMNMVMAMFIPGTPSSRLLVRCPSLMHAL